MKHIKVLVWHDKYGDVMVAARDGAEEAKAWLYIFGIMNDSGYYYHLEGDEETAYIGAKAGNPRDAKWLLELRGRHEYCGVDVEYVTVPE